MDILTRTIWLAGCYICSIQLCYSNNICTWNILKGLPDQLHIMT